MPRHKSNIASQMAAKFRLGGWRGTFFGHNVEFEDSDAAFSKPRRRRILPTSIIQSDVLSTQPIRVLRTVRTIIAVVFLQIAGVITEQLLPEQYGRVSYELMLCLGATFVGFLIAWRSAARICIALIGPMSWLIIHLSALAFGILIAGALLAWQEATSITAAWLLSFATIGVAVLHRAPLACGLYLLALSTGLVFSGAVSDEIITVVISAVIATFIITHAHSELFTRIAEDTKAAIVRAKTAEAVLKSFEDSGDNWFWEINRNGDVTYASPKFCAFLGEGSQDVVGKNLISILSSRLILPGQDSGIDTLKFYLTANLAFRDIIVHLDIEGQKRWISLSGGAIVDERKQVSGHSGIGVDISAIREAESRARQLANYDSLTGLANRAHFHEILEGLVAKSVRQHAPCSLFFIDLDRFKIVNDTLGHPVGDELLRNVSYRIEKVIGGTGHAGRLGGDEFVIVVPHGSSQPELASIAARLIAELSAPYFIGPSQILIGASVGIATGPHDGATADDLMRHADLALYASKEGGRGTYRFYDASMRSFAEARRTLEMDLREALARGELSVVYQPILDLGKKRLAGFEALLRWNHPVKGSISPDQFVPVAEESSLILQLGEWVLRTALADAARWPSTLTIAINLSPVQLQDTGFSGVLMSALANSQIAPSRVELEITESVFLQETPITTQTLAQIQALGVRLALDDFGTGYSSLGYLRKATFNKIKIDRSFVQGIDTRNNANEAIIKAVVALARSYGIVTTAEGAETASEIQALHELGCDQVQGFAYSHPLRHDQACSLAHQGESIANNLVHEPRETRFLMIKNIEIKYHEKSYLAVLRNISSGGAMIEAETCFQLGDRVDLDLPNYGLTRGSICWIESRRAGITFENAIQLREIDNFGSREDAGRGVAA